MSEWVPTFTAAQVRAAEQPVLARGVPLMLYAARSLAEVVVDELLEPGVTARAVRGQPLDVAPGPLVGRILVLAGGGDNGGDALYAAAALLQWIPQRKVEGDALEIDVFRTSDRVHEQAFATALAGGAREVALDGLGDYDLVLDGILGIGTSGAPVLRGAARLVVSALLPAVRSGKPRVIAVDLPSGLHPDDGTTVDDLVLPASVTVTFGGVKTGLATGRGRKLSGAVVFVDFDLPYPHIPAGAAPVAYAIAGLPEAQGEQPATE
ncbi:NAD(P)H-hydrate epimerase [Microbacterium sp. CFBP9034]|uniref:NAD(P)H-hydrate epimerase n=1 Tax=Microbacterium sp. CFBP9034 TaxID=3096540 RepID=UPI002A69FC52|nr:NAD(P)H-hydrate epimerase [Microbacterium sp. CFBP9034]MDY0910032.1 NAD(P)H-hydrate epimerase [Microbacterium sp. CFBP9034]